MRGIVIFIVVGLTACGGEASSREPAEDAAVSQDAAPPADPWACFKMVCPKDAGVE